MFETPLHIVLPVVCLVILTLLSNRHMTFGHPSGSQTLPYGSGKNMRCFICEWLHHVIGRCYLFRGQTILDRYSMNSKCTDPETGRELYVGDSFTRSGRCIRVQCLGSLELWEDRCQVPRLEEKCYRLPPANEFLDYPRCCPTYECKAYKSDGHSITDETRTYNHYGRLLREHITNKVPVVVNPPVHITTTQYRSDGRAQDYGSRFAQSPNLNSTSNTSVFRIN